MDSLRLNNRLTQPQGTDLPDEKHINIALLYIHNRGNASLSDDFQLLKNACATAPAGEFTMGSETDNRNFNPLQRVTLDAVYGQVRSHKRLLHRLCGQAAVFGRIVLPFQLFVWNRQWQACFVERGAGHGTPRITNCN
jgi:hypothetical protein